MKRFIEMMLMPLLAIIILAIALLLSGCETSNKANIKWNGIVPDECVFSSFIIKAWVETQKDTKNKDFSFIKTVSEPCFSALKQMKCQLDYFGYNKKTKELKPIDMNKAIEYREYQNCLNRK